MPSPNPVTTLNTQPKQRTVVVIGNGMVGHRFCEQLVELDIHRQYRIVTFCEEPRAAYDRVGLTQFFAHRNAQKLMIANLDWYHENGIELHVGDRATSIDRVKRIVHSTRGAAIPYDEAILATGSYPFVPQADGMKKRGVFVYRTIEDLRQIIDYAKQASSAAVIGGGLLGLEAAKAAYDLGLKTHVIEFAPRLMPRQLDEAASRVLVKQIEGMGVRVHLQKATQEVLGNGKVQGLRFADDEQLPVDMLIVSAGIRPRDELARECGLKIGDRGGAVVNDRLETSDPHIHAIGEVALHRGMIYGLVAPGYEMAEVVARNLTGGSQTFAGADLSTKLKLMGVDVANFGNVDDASAATVTFEDQAAGVYRKLVFNEEGDRLLGGILVGDASDYGSLSVLAKTDAPAPASPRELAVGKTSDGAGGSVLDIPDEAQICSCNNVCKGKIREAIRENDLTDVSDVVGCTRAGAGCGGCVPMIADLLGAELKAAGRTVNKFLCEHFDYSRQELFEIINIRGIKSFDRLIKEHGRGAGCEICKPAAGSIFASLWNDHILSHDTLQDTNDRFLANIQRGGSYSVVPRVPGGEITPDKLIALGEVAKQFDLYCKITGGQRVDLFGARQQDLPDIWEQLVAAGFESGHAYGKALRTVKSCVGSDWCRYGIGNSVGFAIRLEERYRGLRSPHKLKSAVSGCVRECARGAEQGLRPDRHGERLQPLRRRQRRSEAASRRPAGKRPR